MKIFSWMQSKLNGKQVTKNPNAVASNHHMGQASSKEEFSDWPQSLLAIGTFGLTNLRAYPEADAPHLHTPPPEEEEEEEEEELISYDLEEEETHPSVSESLLNRDVGMISIRKEIFVDKKIRKKSLTFLLKKIIFKSRNGLRDSLPDPTSEKSRMDKALRAILNKKIHPTTKPISDKYLVKKSDDDDDEEEGSIWVKTDSEYIVLEI